MQALTLIHSTSFPIEHYADGLLRESISPRALDNLDQLTSDNGSLRVILVDSAINGGTRAMGPRTAIVGIGLSEQPKWLTDDSIYFDLPGNPSPSSLLNVVKRAYRFLYQKMRADQLERQLSDPSC